MLDRLDGIFFINHALNVKQLSVYSEEERFQQTIQTVESIDKYCPNNMKFMFDSSPDLPDQNYLNQLTDRGMNIVYCGQNPDIANFSRAGARSIAETCAFIGFLDWFSEKGFKARRFYKVSGRYRLNDNFVADDDSYRDAFVFAESETSWMNPEQIQNSGADRLYKLRCWHMDYSLLGTFRNALPNILKDCMMYGIDVEHSYYKHLHLNKVVEVKKIGVCGNIAPNGAYIDE
jgi:hypothetical protein